MECAESRTWPPAICCSCWQSSCLRARPLPWASSAFWTFSIRAAWCTACHLPPVPRRRHYNRHHHPAGLRRHDGRHAHRGDNEARRCGHEPLRQPAGQLLDRRLRRQPGGQRALRLRTRGARHGGHLPRHGGGQGGHALPAGGAARPEGAAARRVQGKRRLRCHRARDRHRRGRPARVAAGALPLCLPRDAQQRRRVVVLPLRRPLGRRQRDGGGGGGRHAAAAAAPARGDARLGGRGHDALAGQGQGWGWGWGCGWGWCWGWGH